LPQVRKKDASKYYRNDSRRYITDKDCLTEPEVLKAYCETHPEAVCVGGYGFFGCLSEGKHREDFIKFDFEKKRYVRSDGKVIETNETYCGKKIPTRVWKGRNYYENRIWSRSRLGIPDLIDGNMIIEAKGGLPSLQKIKTAFGQLVFYREQEPSFNAGFLFPKVWLEAEYIQIAFEVLRKHQITLLPV
jgi:hypothetical protein